MSILGNFTFFYKDTFSLMLGDNLVSDTEILKVEPFKITFLAPEVTEAKVVQVYIVYNGITYTNETVLYYYKTYSKLTKISPTYGPTHGGTVIRVWGEDFDDQAYCFLDGQKIFPVRVNSTFVVCEAPKHKAATNLQFELTFNDYNYNTTTGIKFSYYYDIQINDVQPQYISLDAGRNKVLMDIYG